jgi:hypothetical protein
VYNSVTSVNYRGTSYTDASTTGNSTYRQTTYGIKNYEKAKNIYKSLLIHEQQLHLTNFNNSIKAMNNPQNPNHHHHHSGGLNSAPVASSAANNLILNYQNLISEIQKHIDSLN